VRKKPVSLKLGVASEDYGFAVDLGLPQSGRSMFGLDPEIKLEAVWAGERLRRSNAFAERNGPVVTVLDDAGARQVVLRELSHFDSMMTHGADPKTAPELLELRERMRGWRFYDHFRTDPEAPARRAQVGTRTPVLASDGADIAAALQTIIEIGDAEGLAAAIDDAFPGSHIEVTSARGVFEELLVLNEPETSLHPDLLEPLARLIEAASHSAQVIVVSHASTLVDALQSARDASVIRLEKRLGETQAPDIEEPGWTWPKR